MSQQSTKCLIDLTSSQECSSPTCLHVEIQFQSRNYSQLFCSLRLWQLASIALVNRTVQRSPGHYGRRSNRTPNVLRLAAGVHRSARAPALSPHPAWMYKQGGPANPKARRHTAHLLTKILWCGQLFSARNGRTIFILRHRAR